MAENTDVARPSTRPSMELIYHPRSPFARICYMVALERNLSASISLRKVVVAPVKYEGWSTHNDFVGQYNPSAKIPCLLVYEQQQQQGQQGSEPAAPQALFDSRVISEYFDSFSPEYRLDATDQASRRAFFTDKTILAAINGTIDAEILVIYEERLRGEKGIVYPEWIQGMRVKVVRGLDYLHDAVKRGYLRTRTKIESVSMSECGAAVCLAFLDVRNVDWRHGRDELASWFEQTWTMRDSFVHSHPERDWDLVAKERPGSSRM